MTQDAPTKSTHGGFFAVDRRSWATICGLGLNPAVAYLVLACGTGRDNKRTSWSVQAIEKYTGISRRRASSAVKILRDAKFVKQLSGDARPRYELLAFEDTPSGGAHFRVPMTKKELEVYEAIRQGQQPRTAADSGAANRLSTKGYLRADDLGGYRPKEAGGSEWIWLPNTLVTGAATETPPVEIVRQSQDVMILRLLVDLYDAQNLREDGGISRNVIYRAFERKKMGQQAQYEVWGFKTGNSWAYGDTITVAPHLDLSVKDSDKQYATFWSRFRALTTTGLIEWIPYLFESNTAEAEAIHPYGTHRSESLEDRIGLAAHNAGQRLLTEGQCTHSDINGFWLAPVPRHISNVQMIGIARLLYRPHTKLTSAWFAELNSKGEQYFQQYSALGCTNECAASR